MKKSFFVFLSMIFVGTSFCMQKDYLKKEYPFKSKAYMLQKAIESISPNSDFTEKKSDKKEKLIFYPHEQKEYAFTKVPEELIKILQVKIKKYKDGKSKIKILYKSTTHNTDPFGLFYKITKKTFTLEDKDIKGEDLTALKKILFKKVDATKKKIMDELAKKFGKKLYKKVKDPKFSDVKIITEK
ncbi:hypothetical protein ACFLYU_01880 [Candidatus Dependentiae bacterium]